MTFLIKFINKIRFNFKIGFTYCQGIFYLLLKRGIVSNSCNRHVLLNLEKMILNKMIVPEDSLIS